MLGTPDVAKDIEEIAECYKCSRETKQATYEVWACHIIKDTRYGVMEGTYLDKPGPAGGGWKRCDDE